VLMQTFSKISAKRTTSGVLSKVPRYRGPRVQAKIKAIRLVGVSLLCWMLAMVAGHAAVRGLRLDCLAVRRQQYCGLHTERAVTLRQGIGLYVTVVVLAGPDNATIPLQRQRDHVVDRQ